MDEAAGQAASEGRPPTVAARGLIGFVRLYQATLGRVMGGHCRFSPTCSLYAIDALREHGAVRGGWLTIRRLARCQPFGGRDGDDPVPPSRSQRARGGAAA